MGGAGRRRPHPGARDYLYQAFEPSSQAIAGLEKALAAAGLLDQATQLDLCTPHQDFFDPIWRTGWRASDLAELTTGPHNGRALPSAEPGGEDGERERV